MNVFLEANRGINGAQLTAAVNVNLYAAADCDPVHPGSIEGGLGAWSTYADGMAVARRTQAANIDVVAGTVGVVVPGLNSDGDVAPAADVIVKR